MGLEKIALEEKMNGYNVRIATANGEIIAITGVDRFAIIQPKKRENRI